MTWTREFHDRRSNALRSEGGPIYGLEREPRVGCPAVIVGPPFVPGALYRLLQTTAIIRMRSPGRTRRAG